MINPLAKIHGQTIFFISPHLDDAVLSAAGALTKLKRNNRVTVINLFTKDNGNISTLSARRFLSVCGYRQSSRLFADRRQEDREVMRALNVEVVNLGFTDASWRLLPGLNPSLHRYFSLLPEIFHIYPTYRFHLRTRKFSPHDLPLMNALFTQLAFLIPKHALVFCPLSLGNHVDHVITRQVVESLGRQTYYWVDYPYLLHSTLIPKQLMLPPYSFSLAYDKKLKEKLIRGYHTQLKILFPQGLIKLAEETYFTWRNIYD